MPPCNWQVPFNSSLYCLSSNLFIGGGECITLFGCMCPLSKILAMIGIYDGDSQLVIDKFENELL